MNRQILLLLLLAISCDYLVADVVILKSGKKLVGKVTQSEGGYELTTEDGQTIGIATDDVAKIAYKPQDITDNADKIYDDAKTQYNEALKLSDLKERNKIYHKCIETLNKARDLYLAARDNFSEDQTLYIDKPLQDNLQLIKMFRERLVTEKEVSKEKTKVEEDEAAAKIDYPTKIEQQKTATKPMAKVDFPRLPPSITPIVSLLTDTNKLSDANLRTAARKCDEIAASQINTGGFATAVKIILSEDPVVWDIAGRTGDLVAEYIKAANIEDIKNFGAAEHTKALAILVNIMTNNKATDNELLTLLVAGHIEGILNCGGKNGDIGDICAPLGLAKDVLGWGNDRWFTLKDAKNSIDGDDLDSALFALTLSYKGKGDFAIKYWTAFVKIKNALTQSADYENTLATIKSLSADAKTPKAKQHIDELAKSFSNIIPCKACGGTGQLKCPKCKGKATFSGRCKDCGGTGKRRVLSPSGTVYTPKCVTCDGTGTTETPCPKCNGSGSIKCTKCGGNVAEPKLENVFSTERCYLCSGKGFPFSKVAYSCRKCMGLGVMLAPASDPAKKLVDNKGMRTEGVRAEGDITK